MFVKRYERFWLMGLFAFLFLLYAVLPSMGGKMFASPDETAHAQVAYTIACHFNGATQDPLATQFPWLHPRSYVSVGPSIAPVGFLGWPAFLSILSLFRLDVLAPWIAMLMFLSAVWPVYQFLKKFGQEAAWVGTLITFTFPPMILYGNRSLFSNGIIFAGALWGTWLIRYLSTQRASRNLYVIAGLLCAFVFAVRPIEMLWILPWWLWAGWYMRPTREQWSSFAIGAGVIFLPLLIIARRTYGSWFGIGYALRDNPSPVLQAIEPYGASALAAAPRPWWIPYGFDVKTLLWNGYNFLVKLLWPWALLVAAAKALLFKRIGIRRPTLTHQNAPFWLMVWTAAVIFIIYGGGRYFDHINPDSITIGNSFLRYVLPLTFFLGVAVAWGWRWISEKGRISKRILWGLCVFLVCMGIYKAYAADDEGVFATRRELKRYEQIREEARQWFSAEDLIVSQRSDKIFFPAYRVVSPMPPATEISRFAQVSGKRVGLFARPLTQAEKDAWRQYGFDVQELRAYGRERLYRLVYLKP